MEKGTNFDTISVLNYIGKEKIEEVENYIKKVLGEECLIFQNREEIENVLSLLTKEYSDKLTEKEKNAIIDYTGLGFRRVNPILRGYWDYEKSGKLTEEVKKDAYNLAESMHKVLIKAPTIPFNFTAYRGVGIRAFYPFNITNINDLSYLTDKFIYEPGFTSTSMIRQTSFFAKEPEWGDNCNIEIECIVPAESDDGIALINESLCLSTTQNEFLINSGSLFKVINVEVDKEQNKAKIKMILIPEKIWNPLDYEMERKEDRRL